MMRTMILPQPYATDWNGNFTRLPAGVPIALEDSFAGGLEALGKASETDLPADQSFPGLEWPERVVKASNGARIVPAIQSNT